MRGSSHVFTAASLLMSWSCINDNLYINNRAILYGTKVNTHTKTFNIKILQAASKIFWPFCNQTNELLVSKVKEIVQSHSEHDKKGHCHDKGDTILMKWGTFTNDNRCTFTKRREAGGNF